MTDSHHAHRVIVLVCGGREYEDYGQLNPVLDDIRFGLEPDQVLGIVHGGARGADRMAGYWASDHGIQQRRFPADWNRYGRSAGPVRNQQMLDFLIHHQALGARVQVVAFPGGKGTAHMVTIARRSGIPTHVIPAPEHVVY